MSSSSEFFFLLRGLCTSSSSSEFFFLLRVLLTSSSSSEFFFLLRVLLLSSSFYFEFFSSELFFLLRVLLFTFYFFLLEFFFLLSRTREAHSVMICNETSTCTNIYLSNKTAGHLQFENE